MDSCPVIIPKLLLLRLPDGLNVHLLWLDFGAIRSLAPIHLSSRWAAFPPPRKLCLISFSCREHFPLWFTSCLNSPRAGDSWAVGLLVLELVKSWWTRMGWSSAPYTISICWNSAHFKGPAQLPAGSVSSSICLYIHVALAVCSVFCYRCLCSLLSLHQKCNSWRQGLCLIPLILWGQGLSQGRCLDLICWMNGEWIISLKWEDVS